MLEGQFHPHQPLQFLEAISAAWPGQVGGPISSISLAFSNMTTSGTGISVAGQVQAGDIIVLFDRSVGGPDNTVPTAFTPIVNSVASIRRNILSYKIADGTETTITGMTGSTQTTKTLHVFRPNVPATVLSIGGIVNSGITNSNPTGGTVTVGGPVTPIIVIAAYAANTAIDARTFSPAKDGEINALGTNYLAYKIYNSAPSDVFLDMDDEGDGNHVCGCYLQPG